MNAGGWLFEELPVIAHSAATEPCPSFSGPAERLHWDLPDPASGAASVKETWKALNQRIQTLLG